MLSYKPTADNSVWLETPDLPVGPQIEESDGSVYLKHKN